MARWPARSARFAGLLNFIDMKKKLLLAALCVSLHASLQAQDAQENTPPVAALPSASAIDYSIKEGEIRLTGKVTGVNISRATVAIFADSFTVPNGNSKAIDPPRPKLITLTEPLTVFNPPQNPTSADKAVSARTFPLSALRRGDDVSVIGRDGGNSQSFTARLIYLQAPLNDLLEERARAGFKTKPIENKYQPSGAAPDAEGFKTIRYSSPAGDFTAYLAEPGDDKKHPAVLWAHGGFGGISPADAAQAKPFADAGLVVLCPSWRGENDNPGHFELFGGEVEDLAAGVNYLQQLPSVDPNRIYVAGHSTGGTLALLAAASVPSVRAVFSLGGAPDLSSVLRNGGYDFMPFDKNNAAEVRFRSPSEWIPLMRVPVFYFEGEKSFYVPDAKWMEATAQRQGVDFRTYIIERNDHSSIVAPMTKAIAQKIQTDTGPTLNISFTAEEIKELFPSDAPLGIATK